MTRLSDEALRSIAEKQLTGGLFSQRTLAKGALDLIEENRRLKAAIREIIDDASPCTTACNLLVEERLIEQAKELL